MKTIAYYSILFAAIVATLPACRKNDAQPPTDTRFPLPQLTKDTTGDDFISGKDPASFIGKFTVGLYYGTAVKPRKVDVVVIRNNNKSNVKTIKADVTGFPAQIEVTGIQLATLFDSTINLGDKFEIGADITTTNGQKFEAFPVTGNPYGADTATLPGHSFSIVYLADCKFDISYFNGYYTVQRTTHDYWVGDSILVRPGQGDTILVTAWPYPNHWGTWDYWRVPMIVKIDPVTFEATIPGFQGVGEYCCGGPFIIVEGGSGSVSPCGDKITLYVTVAEAGTTSSEWYDCVLELKK